MVLLGIVGVGQLVDVVPERILAAGNRVPPALKALAVESQVLLVVLQLEGQVVTQHCFFLIGHMNAEDHMSGDFCFSVVRTGVKSSEILFGNDVFIVCSVSPSLPN